MPPRPSIYPSMRLLRWFGDHDAVLDTWNIGIVRDMSRHMIPDGSVYDVEDLFLNDVGKAWKRGGWDRQSAVLPGESKVLAVAAIHIPCRVVAIGDSGTMYDVTSENVHQADAIGACSAPGENPPYITNRLIFCDSSRVPKKVYYDAGADAMAIADLGGTGVPQAQFSCAHLDRIVLAAGPNDGTGHLNRIWFGPVPIPVDPTASEGTWDALSYIDVAHEITGLASVAGALVVFTPHSVYRITGSIPPHTPTDPDSDVPTDMQLDHLAEVGCIDARSIVELDENVIFAGQDGVYLVNSAGLQSLTENVSSTGAQLGIQRLWREIFPQHTFDSVKRSRHLIGGLLKREYYILTILDENGANVVTLCCHVATQTWTRLKNVVANMFAAGQDEQDLPELYMASATDAYVNRLSGILLPSSANPSDGDGTAVLPMIEMKPLGQGSGVGLRSFGYGWVTYELNGSANLKVYTARNILAPSFSLVATLAASALKRKRFTPHCDANALSVRLTLDAAANSFELYSLELEVRPYAEEADYA